MEAMNTRKVALSMILYATELQPLRWLLVRGQFHERMDESRDGSGLDGFALFLVLAS